MVRFFYCWLRRGRKYSEAMTNLPHCTSCIPTIIMEDTSRTCSLSSSTGCILQSYHNKTSYRCGIGCLLILLFAPEMTEFIWHITQPPNLRMSVESGKSDYLDRKTGWGKVKTCQHCFFVRKLCFSSRVIQQLAGVSKIGVEYPK
mgnify:CR=1 FL=1